MGANQGGLGDFSSELRKLLEALQGVRALPDGSWMARCPAHDDREPSLHVSYVGGKILLHCFAGCTYEEIRKALPLDVFGSSYVLERTYVYTDAYGQPLFRKLRFYPKTFYIQRIEGHSWQWGLKGTPLVIYNLPKVLEAEEVYIVEGEKDAETLIRHGLVATTNPNGASEKIVEAYTEPLADKKVVIFPDSDEPGLKHALDWAKNLEKKATSVKVVKLPEKDVTAFLEKHSLSELLALVEKAPYFGKPNLEVISQYLSVLVLEHNSGVKLVARGIRFSSDGQVIAPLTIYHGGKPIPQSGLVYLSSVSHRQALAFSLETLLPTGYWESVLFLLYEEALKFRQGAELQSLSKKDVVSEPEWLLHPLVLKGLPNVICGPSSTLKSWLALALCRSLITGEPVFPGISLFRSGPALYLDWESCPEVMVTRWAKFDGEDLPLHYKFCMAPLIDELDSIGEALEKIRPVLVVVDSLGPAVGGDLVKPHLAISFFAALRQLKTPVLLIAHVPKREADSVFGSVFFTNLSRNIWMTRLLDMDETSARFTIALSHVKSSLGFLHDPIFLEVAFPDEEKVVFRKVALKEEYPELRTNESLSRRILAVLDSGEMAREELAEVLGVSKEAVRKELFRLKKKHLVSEERGKVRKLGEAISF